MAKKTNVKKYKWQNILTKKCTNNKKSQWLKIPIAKNIND